MAATQTAAAALSGDFGVYRRTAAYILRGCVRFEYDSTTLDLVLKALASGAKIGDTLVTSGLGRLTHSWELIPEGGGSRTPEGVWAQRIR